MAIESWDIRKLTPDDLIEECRQIWSDWDKTPDEALYHKAKLDRLMSELSRRRCLNKEDAKRRLWLIINQRNEPEDEMPDDPETAVLRSIAAYLTGCLAILFLISASSFSMRLIASSL